MNELFRHTKGYFSPQSAPPELPKESYSIMTRFGEYGVDVYNPMTHADAPPLVLELGLGRRKESAPAKTLIAQLVDPSRSTFVFQTAKQSPDIGTSVAGHIAAMNSMGIDEYDAIGLSFGGFETILKAKATGGRALHAVTIAAVGELVGGPRAYGRAIPGMLRSEPTEYVRDVAAKTEHIIRSLGEHGAWLAGCLRHPGNTLAQLAIICQSDLLGAVRELSAQTNLTMVVGGLDSVASSIGADRAVQIHREHAGHAMANRVLVRGVSHSLTTEAATIGYVMRAALRDEWLADEIDPVRPQVVSTTITAPTPVGFGPFDEPGLAIAG